MRVACFQNFIFDGLKLRFVPGHKSQHGVIKALRVANMKNGGCVFVCIWKSALLSLLSVSHTNPQLFTVLLSNGMLFVRLIPPPPSHLPHTHTKHTDTHTNRHNILTFPTNVVLKIIILQEQSRKDMTFPTGKEGRRGGGGGEGPFQICTMIVRAMKRENNSVVKTF